MNEPRDIIAETLAVTMHSGRYDDLTVPAFRELTYTLADAILDALRERDLAVRVRALVGKVSDQFVGHAV
jgi:hypothetical protein